MRGLGGWPRYWVYCLTLVVGKVNKSIRARKRKVIEVLYLEASQLCGQLYLYTSIYFLN